MKVELVTLVSGLWLLCVLCMPPVGHAHASAGAGVRVGSCDSWCDGGPCTRRPTCAARQVLRLSGGAQTQRRPGTIDYSKWEQLAKMVSEDDPSGLTEPRIHALDRPSKVTFGGGLGEYFVEEETAEERQKVGGVVKADVARRHAAGGRYVAASGDGGRQEEEEEEEDATTTRRGAAAGRSGDEARRKRSYAVVEEGEAGVDGCEAEDCGAGTEGRPCESFDESTSTVGDSWSDEGDGDGQAKREMERVGGLNRGGADEGRKESTEAESLAALAPDFVTEEEAIASTPAHLRSSWEHDTKKKECVTSEWDAASRQWKPLDYSRWDKLEASEVQAQEAVGEYGDMEASSVVDQHDEMVCRQVLQRMREAIEEENEFALRRALSHADTLCAAGLIQPHQLQRARGALARIVEHNAPTRATPTPASMLERAARLAAGIAAAGDTTTTTTTTRSIDRHKGAAPSEEERREVRRSGTERERGGKMAEEMLAVLTRNGAATRRALWSQTADDVFLYALAPRGTRAKDVAVTVKEKWIRVSVHEAEPKEGGTRAAGKRAVKEVLLCGKLAFRVRVGDGEETDWEMTDVFDANLAPRRAVRIHLRKRPPGANFVPSVTPAWDEAYSGRGMWQEGMVKVWWDRLMKEDAAIPLDGLQDRDETRAREAQEAWEKANEEFKREVLHMKPIDLSPLCAETARDRERTHVREDLVRAGVAEGGAEWEEAMAAADARAAEFADKEILEARAWRDEALAREAQGLGVPDLDDELYNKHLLESQWTTPVNSQGDEIAYWGPYWRPTL